jgi:hypothetical protein
MRCLSCSNLLRLIGWSFCRCVRIPSITTNLCAGWARGTHGPQKSMISEQIVCCDLVIESAKSFLSQRYLLLRSVHMSSLCVSSKSKGRSLSIRVGYISYADASHDNREVPNSLSSQSRANAYTSWATALPLTPCACSCCHLPNRFKWGIISVLAGETFWKWPSRR